MQPPIEGPSPLAERVIDCNLCGARISGAAVQLHHAWHEDLAAQLERLSKRIRVGF